MITHNTRQDHLEKCYFLIYLFYFAIKIHTLIEEHY